MVVKKIAFIGLAAMALSSSAFADDAGFYIGAQLGVGWQHVDNQTVSGEADIAGVLTPVTVASRTGSKNGLAGRIFAGYDFNKCFGAELGYAKFKDVDLRFTVTPTTGPSAGVPFAARGHVETQMVDLLAKGVLPVEEGFSVYGKVGPAYVETKRKVTGVSGADDTKRFRPELAVGAAYNFDEHTAVDVSYAYVWGTGRVFSSNYIPNLSLAAIGVTYKF